MYYSSSTNYRPCDMDQYLRIDSELDVDSNADTDFASSTPHSMLSCSPASAPSLSRRVSNNEAAFESSNDMTRLYPNVFARGISHPPVASPASFADSALISESVVDSQSSEPVPLARCHSASVRGLHVDPAAPSVHSQLHPAPSPWDCQEQGYEFPFPCSPRNVAAPPPTPQLQMHGEMYFNDPTPRPMKRVKTHGSMVFSPTLAQSVHATAFNFQPPQPVQQQSQGHVHHQPQFAESHQYSSGVVYSAMSVPAPTSNSGYHPSQPHLATALPPSHSSSLNINLNLLSMQRSESVDSLEYSPSPSLSSDDNEEQDDALFSSGHVYGANALLPPVTPARHSSFSTYETDCGSFYHSNAHSCSMSNCSSLDCSPVPSRASSAPSSPGASGRKKRYRVSHACATCKKSKTKCDNQRPCGRCVRTGKADCCVDSVHKKRGRKKKNTKRKAKSPKCLEQQFSAPAPFGYDSTSLDSGVEHLQAPPVMRSSSSPYPHMTHASF